MRTPFPRLYTACISLSHKRDVDCIADAEGAVLYRVKLPGDGTTIFVGWASSGAVLAVVQKLGGAFLWFPAKPGTVQQWEGMQFSSKMMKSSVLKRNAHFDTCFACWSESGKLVLGLADGNFAVWDLSSNETFMSRKHFAGKHHNAIMAGAWAPLGEHLALASAYQLKVSQPLLNASWEQTAAKLDLNGGDGTIQQLHFSRTGCVLAAIAGASIFRHLRLYAVVRDGRSRKSEFKGCRLAPLGEVHPGPQLGSLQSVIWLEHETLACIFSSGTLRYVQLDANNSGLREQSARTLPGGVVDAVLLEATSHIAIVSQTQLMFWDPVSHAAAGVVELPHLPNSVRYLKAQAAADFLILSRSDGALAKVPYPQNLQQLDLQTTVPCVGMGRLSMRSEELVESAPKPLSCTPKRILRITAAEGATSSNAMLLEACWSSQASMVAFVNSHCELKVLRHEASSGALTTVLAERSNSLGKVSYLEFDPATEMHLALVMRGAGVGLWQVGSNEPMSMWTGMSYKNSSLVFSKGQKDFDPCFARWSRAGQLAIGMADGSFAVWDSVTSNVSASVRTGAHKSAVTAGDWLSSLFAPALALASSSAIKVSQGFDDVEWPATALKLRTNGDSTGSRRSSLKSPLARRSRVGDADALELRFSPSGQFLALLSAMGNSSEERQLIIYELSQQRDALVVCRELVDFDGGVPIGFHWLPDESLLLFSRNTNAAIRRLYPMRDGTDGVWPPIDRSTPGDLVDAAVLNSQGLCAAVFSGGDDSNVALMLSCPGLEQIALVRLEQVPRTVKLYDDSQGKTSVMLISFARGGIEAWRM